MGHYGDLAGRARISVLLAAAASLVVALLVLSGPEIGGAQEASFSEPSDALNSIAGDGAPPEANERTARIGKGSSSSGRDTEGLRDWAEGTADRRLRERFLSYTTGKAEDFGQSLYGLNFQLQSSLTWGKNDSIKGAARAVVPLGGRGDQKGGRWAYFLQPSINIWDDDTNERRTDLGLGLVGRLRSGANSSLGLGGFIERGRYGHQRASLGTEWRHRRSSLGVNAYIPLSNAVAGVGGRREQVLSGYDVQLKQGIGDRLTFSASANRWNSKTDKSLSSGGSAELSYALTPSFSILSGYTWSDKSLTERSSYSAGFEFRLPADKISGYRSEAQNLYVPFARNERITTQVISSTTLTDEQILGGIRITLQNAGARASLDDSATPQTEVAPVATGQTARTESITLNFAQALDRDICLEMRYRGTATLGEDYEILRSSVRFPKGSTGETFEAFSILNDAGDNPNEPEESLTIDFYLKDLSFCTVSGGNTQAYYTLDIPSEEEIEREKALGLDERVFSVKLRFAPRGTPTIAQRSDLRLNLAVSPSSANEGASVTATVSVQKKSGSSFVAATADDISERNLPEGLPYRLILLNRSATYDEDFSAEDGEAEKGTGGVIKGIFGKGETDLSTSYEIALEADSKTEGNETFSAQLISLSDEADVEPAAGLAVTINDTSRDPQVATPADSRDPCH